MAIKVISFDADQTLWDTGSALSKALHETVNEISKRFDIEPGIVSVEQLQQTRNKILAHYHGQPHSLEEIREHSFRIILERIGCKKAEIEAKHLASVFFKIRFQEIELYPEVKVVLQQLKSRWRLALLTNGNTYPERCGLPNFFEAVVMGPVHGIYKPDPRIFERLAAELGIFTTEIAHVGDQENDIEGAHSVGAMSILIDRVDGATPDLKMRADHTVSDLTELERLIAD